MLRFNYFFSFPIITPNLKHTLSQQKNYLVLMRGVVFFMGVRVSTRTKLNTKARVKNPCAV